MTDTVVIKRLHKPLLQQDQDGSWFTVCHACTADASQPVIRCSELADGAAWPPFKLVEQPYEQPAVTPELVAAMAHQMNRHISADQLPADLIRIIEDHIRSRPRSLQRRIGPSEIGHGCGRYIAYKLADVDTVNPAADQPAWRPQVGTFVHDGLAQVLTAVNAELVAAGYPPRFLIEQRVHACSVVLADGSEVAIEGSGDAYDSWTGTVVDWKIVGPTTLKKVKAVSRQTGVPHGASPRYRIQVHNYGKGYARLGLPVWRVMVAYLPAAGELSDAYFHTEVWDEGEANTSAQRLQGTQALLNVLPLAQVLEMMPTADQFCARCPYFTPDTVPLNAGCSGHAERKTRNDSLYALIPPDGSVT